MQLRPYQQEARDSILREWDAGRQKTLLVLPTGTGKTIVFCSVSEEIVRRGGRVLILAHRAELLDQAADKMQKATGLACAIEKAEQTSIGEWERITVGSVQTLMRPDRLARFRPDHYQMIIVDEAHHCCPAGTTVDERPIETIHAGEFVEAYNHRTGIISLRRVVNTICHCVQSVVRITFTDGTTLCCTPTHPIWNGDSYVDAITLSRYDMVYQRMVSHEAESMRDLRYGVCSEVVELPHEAVLLPTVQKRGEGAAAEAGASKVPVVWKRVRSCWARVVSGAERSDVLFKGMQYGSSARGECANDGRDEPQVCVSTDESQQSDEQGLSKTQDDRSNEGKTVLESCGKRQDHSAPTSVVRRFVCNRIEWICARISRMHKRTSASGREGTELIQGRYRPRTIQNSHRGRRKVARSTEEQAERRDQDRGVRAVRVESVEVFQQGSGPEFERLCPGGVVYNLEVDHENNFFANGILVHNCLAETYQRVLSHFCEATVLGVTATPDRGDKQSLGQFFASLAYEYTLPQAVRDGFLCKIVAQTIPLSIDLAGVKQQNGDYQLSGVATALDPYLEQIADEFLKHRDRKIVAFLPLIATSKKFCHMLQQRGIDAIEVNGESHDRAEILRDFDAAGPSVLCNAMLLTEGWDCPSVDCICVLRPTKIRSLYCQMCGRGTRIHPGKENLLLLDFLWHTTNHELCHPAHLICETPETAAKVTEILAESADAMDLEEAEQTAESDVIKEREEALAKKLRELRKKKAKLVDPLQYEMSIGAEDLADYQPAFGWEMLPASDAQVASLEERGIFAGEITCAGKAHLLLDRLAKRRELGLATPKQIRLLENKGFRHVGQWSLDEASRMITRIASAGWRVPRGVKPETYQHRKEPNDSSGVSI